MNLFKLSIILAIFVTSSCATIKQEKKRVLFVVSNVSDMGDPEKHDARNNLWESAPPYHVFLNHGYEVDFVSPKGGPVEFSMNPIGISRYAIKYERFNEKTQKTLKPDEVDPQKYDAVYFGGGAGPLFDVAHDKNTQKPTESVGNASRVYPTECSCQLENDSRDIHNCKRP